MASPLTDRGGRQFSVDDLQRILDETFAAELQYHDRADSTNDLALAQAACYRGKLPLAILAEEQLGGRGRGANSWWADRGALTFSLLLDAAGDLLPQRSWPTASLLTGLAVAEACDQFVPAAKVGIKWPNDVFVEGRKVCGILVEPARDAPERLVLGIGVNVNNSTRHAPPELRSTATALCDVAGREISLPAVMIGILNRVAHWLARLESGEPDLALAVRRVAS